MSEIPTPRTDAAERNWWSEDGLQSEVIVLADFARELEREIATLKAERDEARREVCQLLAQFPGAGASEGYAEERGWQYLNERNDGK